MLTLNTLFSVLIAKFSNQVLDNVGIQSLFALSKRFFPKRIHPHCPNNSIIIMPSPSIENSCDDCKLIRRPTLLC